MELGDLVFDGRRRESAPITIEDYFEALTERV